MRRDEWTARACGLLAGGLVAVFFGIVLDGDMALAMRCLGGLAVGLGVARLAP